MVLFKINGERNSGTTFLTEILNVNGLPTYVHKIIDRTIHNWKHGVPSNEHKHLNETVVDLFIFRNLEDWLVSMFKNPYELKNTWNNSFDNFLKAKQLSNNYWKHYKYNTTVNFDDNDKTIFEIRQHKFNKIIKYKNDNKDVILINLSYIKNEKNLYEFLDFLCNKYTPELKKEYILSLPHTKTKENIKDRRYEISIDDYREIIESNKNIEMETFINSLTFSY